MARNEYLSIYADQMTKNIFERFLAEKGITKSSALSQFMELYMMGVDEGLYLRLKKEAFNVDAVKEKIIVQQHNQAQENSKQKDGMLLRLTSQNGLMEEEIVKEYEAVEAELGYFWLSTTGPSRGTGIHPLILQEYNNRLEKGESIPFYWQWGNVVRYSGEVIDVVSGSKPIPCPGDIKAVPEPFQKDEMKTWLKMKALKPETKMTVDNLVFCSNKQTVRSALSSRFSFGYVEPIKREEN